MPGWVWLGAAWIFVALVVCFCWYVFRKPIRDWEEYRDE